MPNQKNFFRNVLDAMIESRRRQAAREVAMYKAKLYSDPAQTGRH